MNKKPSLFRREYIVGLNKSAYIGVALGIHGDHERIVVTPTEGAAIARGLIELSEFRADLCPEVVVAPLALFRELILRAALISHEMPPDSPQAIPPAPRPKLEPVPYVGRRRRKIFEESGGKCHYCSCDIELHGKWHVEHKMPRALGGGDEPGNLVASCAPCNHEKRDTTDIEFKSKRAASLASLKEPA